MRDASLGFREQIARMDLTQAELRRLVAESGKLRAEDARLRAEARKLDRGRWLAPLLAVVAAVGGLAGMDAAVVTIPGNPGAP